MRLEVVTLYLAKWFSVKIMGLFPSLLYTSLLKNPVYVKKKNQYHLVSKLKTLELTNILSLPALHSTQIRTKDYDYTCHILILLNSVTFKENKERNTCKIMQSVSYHTFNSLYLLLKEGISRVNCLGTILQYIKC